ncbi:MAG: MoxR family ATPase [Thermodesulfobacteriota bacterium]
MADLHQIHAKMQVVKDRMARIILGQDTALEHLLTCFLAGGHVLLEGVPGLGKTLLARSLAKLVYARFRRIQFTPDLLPSDIIGTNVFNPKTMEFALHKGPVFTEILLADEVNRTPPKSQAALLEAMEERQVTIDGVRNILSPLFFVIATQNPLEYEGTYPLPETQLDRFMMKVTLDYPPPDAELDVIRSYSAGKDLHKVDAIITGPLLSREEVADFRMSLVPVTVKEEVMKYILRITSETRDPNYVQLGASPRAGVALLRAARALAALRGMEFVTPDEVKDTARPVLRHRVILRPEALIDGLTSDDFLEGILKRVAVPR